MLHFKKIIQKLNLFYVVEQISYFSIESVIDKN